MDRLAYVSASTYSAAARFFSRRYSAAGTRTKPSLGMAILGFVTLIVVSVLVKPVSLADLHDHQPVFLNPELDSVVASPIEDDLHCNDTVDMT